MQFLFPLNTFSRSLGPILSARAERSRGRAGQEAPLRRAFQQLGPEEIQDKKVWMVAEALEEFGGREGRKPQRMAEADGEIHHEGHRDRTLQCLNRSSGRDRLCHFTRPCGFRKLNVHCRV